MAALRRRPTSAGAASRRRRPRRAGRHTVARATSCSRPCSSCSAPRAAPRASASRRAARRAEWRHDPLHARPSAGRDGRCARPAASLADGGGGAREPHATTELLCSWFETQLCIQMARSSSSKAALVPSVGTRTPLKMASHRSLPMFQTSCAPLHATRTPEPERCQSNPSSVELELTIPSVFFSPSRPSSSHPRTMPASTCDLACMSKPRSGPP